MDEEIKKVNSDIEKCEGEIKIASSNVLQSTGEDKQYWMNKENALRAEKNALRAKENALRAEKNALRAKENALMAKENALMAEKKPVNEANILPKYSEGI